ncbi:MAG: class I SAM-dependent methyltransferase [Hyphomonas sp.]|nr:class I SAM-dependent methyltransferase [Hyphomonas sp.]
MSNEEQVDYWNGPGGERWAVMADRLDRMLAPFAEAVASRAAIVPGERVLDIGCGAGALTLKAAAAAGETGGALGVDISGPLLGVARQRAAAANLTATFEQADASQWRAPQPVNAVVSRFGVMFFDAPAPAFANIRASAAPGARMTFICWQPLRLNDWVTVPLKVALPFLKEPPVPGDPSAPGPFAFQDKDRVAGILSEAGWTGIAIEPFETRVAMPGDDLAMSAQFMMKVGPHARLLAEQEVDAAPVEAALAEELAAHQDADGAVSLAAACWMVTAENA